MSEDQKIQEREPRVTRPFTVRINVNAAAETPRWDIVMAKDISASGILFNYDRYLEPGSRIQFKISLPFCGHVECEGDVVRNVMGTSRGFGQSEQTVCAVAAVFRNIPEEEEQSMRDFFRQCHEGSGSAEKIAPVIEHVGKKTPRAKRIDRQYITRMQRDGSDRWELVPVQNLSSSGIFFNYGEELEAGAELSFQITLPFLSSPALCRGQIVRTVDQTRPGAMIKVFGIGVMFSDFEEAVRQQLQDYAEKVGRE